MIQEPVQARDAAVVDPLHAISERLGDERRFLGDREIGGARRGDDDEPAFLARLRPDDQEPRLRVMDVGQAGLGNGGRDRLIGPRGHDVRVVVGQAPRDRNDLSRRLAGAEYCLGSPAAQRR